MKFVWFSKIDIGERRKNLRHWVNSRLDGMLLKFYHSICNDLQNDVNMSAIYKRIDSTALLWQKEASDIYHLNLSYCCFHILPSVLFFQAKCYASTLVLLRDMLGKTSLHSIDVNGNDRHILLFYKKFHFCHLLPFAKVGQSTSHACIRTGAQCMRQFISIHKNCPYIRAWELEGSHEKRKSCTFLRGFSLISLSF